MQNRTSGSPLVALLLLIGALLVSALAWQGFVAARSHRQVAEDVLRDYAELAADELIRRSVNQVGYYGYFPLITELEQRFGDPQVALAAPPTWASQLEPRTQRAVLLIRCLFRRLANGEVEVTDETDLAVRNWLTDELPTTEGDVPYAASHPQIAGTLHTLVYTQRNRHGVQVGFEVETTELQAWFAEAHAHGPLLPETLIRSTAIRGTVMPSTAIPSTTAEPLEVQVRNVNGETLFRAGDPIDNSGYAPHLTVELPFGDRYQGIFDGYVASATIDPEAAAALLIGGLPRSRLPLLALLLVLTLGVLATAVVQIRRERALAQLRSDFVSEVSHELRTPLTQIRMFAETLLLGRVRSDTEQRRSLEIIDREARRLSHLVENILQFSRGERGTLQLARRPRRLAPLLDKLVERLAPLTGKAQLVRDGQLDDAVRANVDEDALHQILLNLLDNAAKYGPSEQQIRIGWQAVGVTEDGVTEGATVRLTVSDQGPGVPTNERERIWQSFERLERDRGSAIAGTGIGLSVVRELASQHGGKAWVESPPTGQGASFVVELPLLEVGEDTEAGG